MKEKIKKNAGEKIVNLSTKILTICSKGKTLDDALDTIREENYSSTISDIVFNYYRHKGTIDYIIAKFADQGRKKTPEKFKKILQVAVTQAFYQTGIESEKAFDIAVAFSMKKYGIRPSGFINAVLRNISSKTINSHLIESPKNINIPACLLKRWKESFSSELELFEELLAKKPDMTFRLTSNISNEELTSLGCRKLDLPEWGGELKFYSTKEPSTLFEKYWVQEGKIYIQDPSTCGACNMYSPKTGDIVLDLCSAPGGKTMILAEKSKDKGFVVSADLSLKRQERTKENILSHKITNCNIISASALTPPFSDNSADLVFLDVPCSNTGVFRRRPDVLWNFSEKKLKELGDLQRKILEHCSRLVKKGGKLIYSTCSIEKEENCEQISSFLYKHTEFELIKELQLLPSKKHDGAYSALLEKK